MIQLRLLYFAALRERLAVADEQLRLAADSRVADLISELAGRPSPYKEAFAANESLRVAVNRKFAAPDTRLADGDEVGLFPPVTGG